MAKNTANHTEVARLLTPLAVITAVVNGVRKTDYINLEKEKKMNYTTEINCCEVAAPSQTTLKEIMCQIDEHVTSALTESIRLIKDLYGLENEVNKAAPQDFFEAAICIRDKAEHLRGLLMEINRRTGV